MNPRTQQTRADAVFCLSLAVMLPLTLYAAVSLLEVLIRLGVR